MVKKIADILLWALFFVMCACSTPMVITHTQESEYIDTLDMRPVIIKKRKVTTNNNNVYEVKITTSITGQFIEGRYYGIEGRELTFCNIYPAEDSVFIYNLYNNPLNYDR